jgi:hypothetical protein
MPPSPESANPTLPVSPDAAGSRHKSHNSSKSDDLPYMTMTVVAILLLLGSLWIF